ncbi:MAG: molybdenum cofactor biosynthesis protein MoaE [Proteobacteria bacterium]|nr:molybdenum cofactor biosynthesis protein MoaE [Pseudomonadota bacterium]
MIRVQKEDFDVGREIDALAPGNTGVGGIACFIGVVRDFIGDDKETGTAVGAITLEHYPGMTEQKLEEIEAEARRRWPLDGCLVIHRYGRLELGDRIVMVATAAAHRADALDACQFLIDWLKTEAPFWKLEETATGGNWVDARASDDHRAARWIKK